MYISTILSRAKNYFSKSSYLRDILKVFSSNIAGLFLSFFTGIVTARYLGVEGKGLLAILMVYPQIILTFSQMGIRQAAVYEIGRSKHDFRLIVGNIVTFFIISSLVGTLLSISVLKLTRSEDFTFLMIFLASSTIPLALAKSFSEGIFLGKQKINLAVLVSWLPRLITFVLLIILLAIFGMGLTGALIATVAAAIPVAYYSVKKVAAEVNIKPLFNKEIAKNMLTLGFVYAFAIFLNSLNYRIDIIMLERLSEPEQIGLYSVGVTLAELVLQVPAALGIVVFSRSSNAKDPKKFSNTTKKLFKYGLLSAVLLGSLIAFIAPYLIPLLYGEEFKESAPMLQFLMPGIIALVGYKIIGFDMAGKGKPWASILASLPGVVVNIGLNFFLIPEFGGIGAAISSSFSYSIMALTHWIMFKTILKKY